MLGGAALMDPIWGFGGRGGVRFSESGYLGATFLYHPASGESASWRWYTGPEIGVELGTMPMSRLSVGAGYGRVYRTEGWVDPETTTVFRRAPSQSSLVVWPGASFLFPIESAFVGFDVRVLVWSNTGDKYDSNHITLASYATAGVKL